MFPTTQPPSREYLSFSVTFSELWSCQSSMELQTGESVFPPCCFARPACTKCCLWGWSLVPDQDFHVDAFIWPMSKSCWFLLQNIPPPPHSYLETGPEILFCHISISGGIVFLTMVAVVCLPHSCREASGKVISSSLCPWPCHWLFVFLHCFSLPSQLRNKWAIPICSLLFPIIPLITLELPALTWALLKPLKVQLLNAERCTLEVFLHSAGALYIQTLLPASLPLHKSFPVAFGSGWAGSELRVPCPMDLHRQHLLSVPQQALGLICHFEGWNLGLGLGFLGAAVIQIINCSSVCLTPWKWQLSFHWYIPKHFAVAKACSWLCVHDLPCSVLAGIVSKNTAVLLLLFHYQGNLWCSEIIGVDGF